jgi:hypothetical protein
MVKKLPTKSEQRAQLEQEMDDYLLDGGKVDEVPTGTSGKDPSKPPVYLAGRLFSEPPSSRTYVPEVVAAIEARRQEKTSRPAAKKSTRSPQPRKKVIYDDFGEPLRTVWVDD